MIWRGAQRKGPGGQGLIQDTAVPGIQTVGWGGGQKEGGPSQTPLPLVTRSPWEEEESGLQV